MKPLCLCMRLVVLYEVSSLIIFPLFLPQPLNSVGVPRVRGTLVVGLGGGGEGGERQELGFI